MSKIQNIALFIFYETLVTPVLLRVLQQRGITESLETGSCVPAQPFLILRMPLSAGIGWENITAILGGESGHVLLPWLS